MEFVDANGLRFAYLSAGTGPLVLLLHGFPDTPHTFEHPLAALAGAGYRAVAPFMRGYHPTAIPRDGAYDVETLAKDALALIEALGARDAIVIGHDWGAAAAYTAAGLSPERVRLLITIGIPHPRSLTPSPTLAWQARHFLALRRKRAADDLRANDFAYLDELVRRWSPGRDVPATDTAHVKEAFREPGSAEAACAYYAAVSLRMPAPLRVPITVPTVTFAGAHDQIAVRMYEKARRCFTASYEVVEVPGGHFMHRDYPHEFTTELLRVLRDHEERMPVASER